jgi:hypothetical protein
METVITEAIEFAKKEIANTEVEKKEGKKAVKGKKNGQKGSGVEETNTQGGVETNTQPNMQPNFEGQYTEAVKWLRGEGKEMQRQGFRAPPSAKTQELIESLFGDKAPKTGSEPKTSGDKIQDKEPVTKTKKTRGKETQPNAKTTTLEEVEGVTLKVVKGKEPGE